ncbi:SGT1-domain-containing protein [Coniochaeta ligniaria NRRL 30616]|uniref:SGT1-domain-containing protein n=1 Tax=Coniochaeta ligniaria NRRL 30616 TaxID=1408157 RepID=A0A1J7JGT3_9PEZI|nr:SGT1-domain-containing protein [Coniochaeta ligniaria NRRL 30616]
MATSKEADNPELRPGDEGFQGFQMQLPENCIEYMLFILDAQVDNKKVLSSLEEVRKAALRLADDLTKDYIWQRDSFNLELKHEKGLAYLWGSTDYGDCVEDEWLVVYLLRELTKSFSNLWVRVADSDGEFLLVEAANVLPKWLSPEIDANRVWIRDGKLHLIPLSGDERSLSLPDAVKVLESKPETLVHSPFVEAEAFYRLEKYPGQISEHLHHSKITVPRKLAYILHDRPKAIAPATEAFYLRDAFSLKPLLSEKATLTFPPVDLVTVSVRFTKVLFAQLKSQRFEPPPAWKSLMQAAETEAINGTDEAQKKLAQLEMGMKVTSGFEMLAKKAAKSNNRIVREIAIVLEDLEEDGDSAMPTDADIKAWKDFDREDDESWLDINYNDFERELEGRASGKPKSKSDKSAGFGDFAAQADLKKIVSRFEAFLNDEEAGMDGAELDEMDEDDDDEDEDDEMDTDDDSEMDKEVSFDENQFASMMREMMGFPSQPEGDKVQLPDNPPKGKEVDTNLDDDAEIQQLMKHFESELKAHGALDLDPKPEKPATIKGKAKEQLPQTSTSPTDEGADDDESGDDEVDIDYNLAKNLLESFKGQAGLAGPAGNILSMMGFQLPRDEGDDDDDEKAP